MKMKNNNKLEKITQSFVFGAKMVEFFCVFCLTSSILDEKQSTNHHIVIDPGKEKKYLK